MAFMDFSKGSTTLTQFRGIPLSTASFKDNQTSSCMLRRTSMVFACPTFIPLLRSALPYSFRETTPCHSHSMWFLWD